MEPQHLANAEGGQRKEASEDHQIDSQGMQVKSESIIDHNDNHRKADRHSPAEVIVSHNHSVDDGGGGGEDQHHIVDAHIHVITEAPHKLEHQDSGASGQGGGHSPSALNQHDSPPIHSELPPAEVVEHSSVGEKHSSSSDSLHSHLYSSNYLQGHLHSSR